MANITFQFNRTKAIEAILYLANNIPKTELYGICKLLYHADKVSLQNYGRFIFGESYVAMNEGATPSNVYDLLKEAAWKSNHGIELRGNSVVALREPNLDYLSDSDIKCLDQTIGTYGTDPRRSRDDAHDAAYYKSWNKKGNKRSIEIPVEDIANLFPDSVELVNYICNSDPL